MSNTSISLTSLDFASIKQNLSLYLQSQDRFSDYDFTGSNFNVLLDVLSYNTFLNAFYLNMVGNEMFIDSAQIRDSVVSHAKALNYTPRSFTSAAATVDISITPANNQTIAVTIPARTTFTSKVGSDNYTFSTTDTIILNNYTTSGGNRIFTAAGTAISEGVWVTDTFVVRANDTTRMILTNKTVDTNSITVTVLEDNQATIIDYSKATSLFGLSADSTVYFVQGAENFSYEIVFGDNVVARKPKDNSVVVVQYRTCNGQLPNGATKFLADGPIDGHTNISILTVSRAAGGTVAEDLAEIKYNAPRAFQTQERAVTVEDYRTLLLSAFPEINDVHAYGGEQLNPPQFGKVYLAVDLEQSDKLPQSKRDQFYSFIKSRSPISIDPVFVEPDYSYIVVDSSVSYNINTTSLSRADIRSLVLATIVGFSDTNLNRFATKLSYSRLVGAIDDAQRSIISNQTKIRLAKRITPTVGVSSRIDVPFSLPLITTLTDLPANSSTVSSSVFVVSGTNCILADDGRGSINVVSAGDRSIIVRRGVGLVNYTTGLVQLTNLTTEGYGGYISIYVVPFSVDVSVDTNVILAIDPADVTVNVVQVRA